jgi:hypothetical protein
MGIKDQLTEEQFKAIYNGPFAAAMYVATASGGGFEMVSELLSSRPEAKSATTSWWLGCWRI